MSYRDGVSGQVRDVRTEKSVANFFDDNGYLCQDLFEREVKKLHSSLLSEKKNL